SHAVDSLPHQLRDEEARAHAAQQRIVCGGLPRGLHDEVVNATRVARRLEAEAARRVAAQYIALEDSILHQLAVARGGTLVIERSARQALRDMRPLAHLEEGREDPLAGRIQKEGGLAVLTRSADRADEVPVEAAGHVGREEDRRLARGQLARADSGQR